MSPAKKSHSDDEADGIEALTERIQELIEELKPHFPQTCYFLELAKRTLAEEARGDEGDPASPTKEAKH